MEGVRLLGLEGGVTRRVGRGAPCLSDSRFYLLRREFINATRHVEIRKIEILEESIQPEYGDEQADAGWDG